MTDLPACPQCGSALTYPDGALLICPECGHEWSAAAERHQADAPATGTVRAANGNLLVDGDSVTVVKDLQVKGAASALKVGTRVKNICLVEGDHNIDGRIEGLGAMRLKSEFVKNS